MGVTDFPELSRKVTLSVGSIIGLMVVSAWLTWGAAAIWWDFKLQEQKDIYLEEKIRETNDRLDRKTGRNADKIKSYHNEDGDN